ncbi:MAG: hypothetical protein HQL42_02340 [Alphaproteobacteria bacterium]|nr:hypothetical protein [Alphaproteobacteria bacterium]
MSAIDSRDGGRALYLGQAFPTLARTLSLMDHEPASPSRGSFDRTWWCWKFTDFSASRFQEGVFTLAWLYDSPHGPAGAAGNPRLLEMALHAARFWTGLQHGDGSFDEAYPFERSLAATAFTGFYVGMGIERLLPHLTADQAGPILRALDHGATWLSASRETHGVLSNHLAAAAAALEVAGTVLGTDRFRAARDRHIDTIARNQNRSEGWLREYGGADPGYQSLGLFYLGEIWHRTGDPALLEVLTRTADFQAWFAHPDGTMGGEYASRGTKFGWPAGFETLAAAVPAAAAIARHLRRCLTAGRGIGPEVMDPWNHFPMLNNYLLAAERAAELDGAPDLPWQADGASRVFPECGLAVAHAGGRLLAAAPGQGGAAKLWDSGTGTLLYEDCGYLVRQGNKAFTSQTPGEFQTVAGDGLTLECESGFAAVPATRFDPWRFMAFRLFMLTLGRWPVLARRIKELLVFVLIRRRRPHPAKLKRRLCFAAGGDLVIDDRVTGAAVAPEPVARQVPIHMGSARYGDLEDWLGPALSPPALNSHMGRRVEINPRSAAFCGDATDETARS